MKRLGIAGIRRGKRITTTVAGDEPMTASDKAQREFNTSAPNQIWVADFTYVSTWQSFVLWPL